MTTDLGQRVRSGHEPRYPQEGGDLAGVGVRNWDSHGRRVWIQPGAAELCGYYGSDAVGSGAAGAEAGGGSRREPGGLRARPKRREGCPRNAERVPGGSRKESTPRGGGGGVIAGGGAGRVR